MYLQVHFLTDILGGVIIGIILGFTAKKITEKKLC
jgi:membrane-associated phospholipid phosphatase